DFELAFSILLDDGIDLVEEAVADEDRALVAEPQRARIRHAAHEHFDLESLRQLELRDRQFVRGHGEGRRVDAAQLGGRVRGSGGGAWAAGAWAWTAGRPPGKLRTRSRALLQATTSAAARSGWACDPP